MGIFFPDPWLEELRSRMPLEEVVSEYVQMKPKGRRLWGCCPFHSEKTPSFSVDTETQMYYCFGCHKGGTVFTFVQEMERMEFQEAVVFLAEKAHMALPEQNASRRRSDASSPRERLYEANREAAKWFHANLWTSEGAQALNYLYGRGLADRDIRRFGLGASLDRWDALLEELTKKGFTEKELVDAGLCTDRTGKAHDMFRARVMFPIINAQGRVLGFGGRAMGKAEPKYMNTGDTPIFNKRQGLYSLNLAKAERDAGRLVLVEGYMDVCSLRKAGVRGVVATLGTALTEEQARLMKRYAPEVIVSYDGDSAGRAAALRALDILERAGMPARVVDYPEGMDPDDFVKAKGEEGFESLRRYKPHEYRMLRAADGLDISSGEGMTEYVTRCCGILSRMDNAIERENEIRRLASLSGFSESALLEQTGHSARRAEERPARPRPPRRAEKDAFTPAQSALLTLMTMERLPDGLASAEDMPEGALREAAEALLAGKGIGAVLDAMEEGPGKEELVRAVHFSPLPQGRDERIEEAASCVESIRRQKLEDMMAEIEQRLAGGIGPEEKKALYERMQAIQEKLDRLNG